MDTPLEPAPLDLDSSALRTTLETCGLKFQARFLSQATQRNPRDLESLAELGNVYTRLGRHKDGLRVDEELSRMLPGNATVLYNLACSLALVDRPDAALDALEEALQNGYEDLEHLLEDEDLASLHAEPRFRQLIRKLDRSAEA